MCFLDTECVKKVLAVRNICVCTIVTASASWDVCPVMVVLYCWCENRTKHALFPLLPWDWLLSTAPVLCIILIIRSCLVCCGCKWEIGRALGGRAGHSIISVPITVIICLMTSLLDSMLGAWPQGVRLKCLQALTPPVINSPDNVFHSSAVLQGFPPVLPWNGQINSSFETNWNYTPQCLNVRM